VNNVIMFYIRHFPIYCLRRRISILIMPIVLEFESQNTNA
jgi:hypothetical protein